MKWTEGNVHVAMRRFLRSAGWTLIAGEYPGGSDHELYALNVVDPVVACDGSPDPRRHSRGELIPDLIALKANDLLIAEAKVGYDSGDQAKLDLLLNQRRFDLLAALASFAVERDRPQLLPLQRLVLHPVLVFLADGAAPPPPAGFSYLRIIDRTNARFEGALAAGIP